MESVSDALKRLADGASCEGFPTDARELREVEKRVAELIAAVEADFEIRKNILRYTVEEIQAATDRLYAALLACKGQDHER